MDNGQKRSLGAIMDIKQDVIELINYFSLIDIRSLSFSLAGKTFYC